MDLHMSRFHIVCQFHNHYLMYIPIVCILALVHLDSRLCTNKQHDALKHGKVHFLRRYFLKRMDPNIDHSHMICHSNNPNYFCNQQYKLHLGIIDLQRTFLDYI